HHAGGALLQPGRRRHPRRARPLDRPIGGRAMSSKGAVAEQVIVADTAEPVLSVRDLRTSFLTRRGPVEIVKGVSFDIGAEETLAVVGESGSGKSVTALSIMRLLDPETSRIEGSVKLGGRELLGLGPADMRSVRGRQM